MEALHQFSNTEFAGAPLGEAKRAIVMVHGRGDDTTKMKKLAKEVVSDPGMAIVYPQATNKTWYPKGFMVPSEENQPWLGSALENLGNVIQHLQKNGIAKEHIFLLGFSQGACLAMEYATQNATRYAGVMVLSGGLIGPEIDLGKYPGNFAGTEIFMGCSDVDFHIPLQRLHESEKVVKDMNADVELRVYPGMDHLICEDEIEKVKTMLS